MKPRPLKRLIDRVIPRRGVIVNLAPDATESESAALLAQHIRNMLASLPGSVITIKCKSEADAERVRSLLEPDERDRLTLTWN